MPRVRIKGSDTVLNFPDSMSQADIETVLKTDPTVQKLVGQIPHAIPPAGSGMGQHLYAGYSSDTQNRPQDTTPVDPTPALNALLDSFGIPAHKPIWQQSAVQGISPSTGHYLPGNPIFDPRALSSNPIVDTYLKGRRAIVEAVGQTAAMPGKERRQNAPLPQIAKGTAEIVTAPENTVIIPALAIAPTLGIAGKAISAMAHGYFGVQAARQLHDGLTRFNETGNSEDLAHAILGAAMLGGIASHGIGKIGSKGTVADIPTKTAKPTLVPNEAAAPVLPTDTPVAPASTVVVEQPSAPIDPLEFHKEQIRARLENITPERVDRWKQEYPDIYQAYQEMVQSGEIKPLTELSSQSSVSPSGDSVESVKPTEPVAPQETPPVQTAPKPVPSSRMVVGRADKTLTPANTEVPFHYAVVEADDLIASHDADGKPNPAYSQELQPRDRTRIQSKVQISDIAKKLNFGRVSASPTTAEGAPLVGQDMQVESGNGRTVGIKEAYASGKANDYRQSLINNAADFGISEKDVAGFTHPVLVRVSDMVHVSPEARAMFAEEAGSSPIAGMSAKEKATADGKRLLSSGILSEYVPGNPHSTANQGFVKKFLAGLPKSEHAGFMTDDGALSAEGSRRITNALLSAAYGDSHIIQILTEDTDNNIKNVGNVLTNLAPRVARVKDAIAKGHLHDLDLGRDITQAAEKFAHIKDTGGNVSAFLAHDNIFGDNMSPAAKSLLRIFEENKRSGAKVENILSAYLDAVEKIGHPDQESMFATEVPTKEELLKRAEGTIKDSATAGFDFEAKEEPSTPQEAPKESVANAPKEKTPASGSPKHKIILTWAEANYFANEFPETSLGKHLEKLLDADAQKPTKSKGFPITLPEEDMLKLREIADKLTQDEQADGNAITLYKRENFIKKVDDALGKPVESKPVSTEKSSTELTETPKKAVVDRESETERINRLPHDKAYKEMKELGIDVSSLDEIKKMAARDRANSERTHQDSTTDWTAEYAIEQEELLTKWKNTPDKAAKPAKNSPETYSSHPNWPAALEQYRQMGKGHIYELSKREPVEVGTLAVLNRLADGTYSVERPDGADTFNTLASAKKAFNERVEAGERILARREEAKTKPVEKPSLAELAKKMREEAEKDLGGSGRLQSGLEPEQVARLVRGYAKYITSLFLEGVVKVGDVYKTLTEKFGEIDYSHFRQAYSDALTHFDGLRQHSPDDHPEPEPLPYEGGKYVGSRNVLVQKYNQGDVNTILEMMDKNQAAFEKQRPKFTQESATEAAKKEGVLPADWEKSPPGTPFNDVQVKAIKMAVEASRNRYNAARLAYSRDPSAENKAALDKADKEYTQREIIYQGSARTASSTLNAYKETAEAVDPVPIQRANEILNPKPRARTATKSDKAAQKTSQEPLVSVERENPSRRPVLKLTKTEVSRANALRASIREKLSGFHSEVIPGASLLTVLPELAELGGIYIKGGLRTFAEWLPVFKNDFTLEKDEDYKKVYDEALRAHESQFGAKNSPQVPSVNPETKQTGFDSFPSREKENSSPPAPKQVNASDFNGFPDMPDVDPATRQSNLFRYQSPPVQKINVNGIPPPLVPDAEYVKAKANVQEAFKNAEKVGTQQAIADVIKLPALTDLGVYHLEQIAKAVQTSTEGTVSTPKMRYGEWRRKMLADTGGKVSDAFLRDIWKRLRPEVEARTGVRAQAEDIARRELLKRIPPEMMDEVTEAFKKLDVTSPNFYKDIENISRKYAGVGGIQALLELRRAGLLSSTRTIAKVLVSHGIFLGAEELSKYPASVIDALVATKTGSRTVFAPRVGEMLRAARVGALQGGREALLILKHGERGAERHGVKQITSSRSTFEETVGEVVTKSPIADAYIKTILRAHGAAYRPFKVYAFVRSLQEQARVIATKEGLRGNALKGRMKDLLDNPTEQMSAQAISDTEYATFLNDNKLNDLAKQARSSSKVGKAVMTYAIPVSKVPTNIWMREMEYGGGTLTALTLLNKEQRAAIGSSLAEQQRFSKTFGRGVIGLGLIAAGYMLAQKEILSGIGDKKRHGNVQVGDYQGELTGIAPVGMLLQTGATLHHWDNTNKPSYLADATALNFENPYLRFAEQFANPHDSSGKDLIGNQLGSWVPTLLSDIAAQMDHSLGEDAVRRKDSPLDYMQVRIPGMREKLEPKNAYESNKIFDPFNIRKSE